MYRNDCILGLFGYAISAMYNEYLPLLGSLVCRALSSSVVRPCANVRSLYMYVLSQ